MINFVEMLRVRSSLTIYLLVIVLIEIVVFVSILASHPGHVHTYDIDNNGKNTIPFSAVLAVCGFCTVIFATIAASSTASDRRITLNWTRPISRERLILSYMLVDVIAILVAYAVVVGVLGFSSLATFGLLRYLEFDADAPLVFATLFGAALMWYAMIGAITAWLRVPPGAVSGVSWGVFITLIMLGISSHLPSVLHALIGVINIFNPLSYASFTQSGDGKSNFPAASTLRALAVYAFALSAMFFALIGWKRAEL